MHVSPELIKVLNEKVPIISQGKVTLSVGESILLLIDACEEAGNIDLSIIDELNQLYLEGIKTAEDINFIENLKNILNDKNYVVKSDPKTISEDPVRRYFETTLAFCILQNNAESLSLDELRIFKENLKMRLYSLPGFDCKDFNVLKKILKGETDAKLLDKYQLEYAELNKKLLEGNFYGLSERTCQNLYEISCSTALATLNTQIDLEMPVDIYDDSIFSMGMDGRGRILKRSNEDVRVTAKGLMKSTSPLPLYHDLVNPVEEQYLDKEKNNSSLSLFQRSADQADFMIESQWSQHLFSRQVHPYSNGISSTTLAQIRNIILQKRLGNLYFEESFQHYMTIFAALMVYNSGGHSFFEIFEVFKLPQCQELIIHDPNVKKLIDADDLMYKWLCEDQKEAFKKSLEFTKKYMRTLINKKILNAQFKFEKKINFSLENESQKQTLHHAIAYTDPDKFDKLIKNLPKLDSVDQLNGKKWTPLMVASQLGKTEHVKILVANGADINKQVEHFSPLVLAIKSQKFDTIKLLLASGAIVRIKNKLINKGLKRISPALYFACRQFDMRILEELLKPEHSLKIEDKREALLVALKFENLDAVQTLIKDISEDDIKRHFSDSFKYKLLNEAVKLGNTKLIKLIMESNLCLAPNKMNYESLLNIAAEKGFSPTIKQLLQVYPKDKLSMNINKGLITALKNYHFETAIIFIIYGADPSVIPVNAKYLTKFDEFLQKAKCYDLLFTEKENEIIAQRAKDIAGDFEKRTQNPRHNVTKNIVSFLNKLLPNFLKFGYNYKIRVIENLSIMFTAKAKESSIDGSNGIVAKKR